MQRPACSKTRGISWPCWIFYCVQLWFDLEIQDKLLLLKNVSILVTPHCHRVFASKEKAVNDVVFNSCSLLHAGTEKFKPLKASLASRAKRISRTKVARTRMRDDFICCQTHKEVCSDSGFKLAGVLTPLQG